MIGYSALTHYTKHPGPQVSQEPHAQHASRGSQANESGQLDPAGRRPLPELKAKVLLATSPIFRALTGLELENSVPGKVIWKSVLLAVGACISVIGCRTRLDGVSPSIEFTRIPPAEVVRADKLDIIQGRVTGARPEQQVVLYARTGAWWIQPVLNSPFTRIQPDSTWINSTHLGSEYAALLVEPGYHARGMMSTLPTRGGDVVAVASVDGATSGATTATPLQFSGYEWRARGAPSDRGDTRNIYDPANVWTDAAGALHLRIAKQADQWTCAEVTLTRSFGYGTYSFVVRDTSQLEPAAVFAMFTWDYAGGDQNNREMDIEIGRWGDPASKNAQYEIQPFYVSANVARLMMPSGVLTHSFRWEPGRVSFRTTRRAGAAEGSGTVGEHVFSAGVPAPGAESVRMALYRYGNGNSVLKNGAEVVVEKFEYLP